jgi:DNA-binding MarR family transcriptional regulator
MERGKDKLDNIQSELSEFILHIEYARRKDEKMGQLDRSAFRLLAELSEEGPMGINALADKFKLDNSTVGKIRQVEKNYSMPIFRALDKKCKI